MCNVEIHYFTDCAHDTGGLSRLTIETRRCFQRHEKSVHVTTYPITSDIQGALCLVDAIGLVLDRGDDTHYVFLANAAPRNGKWKNGTPFGYVWLRSNILVVATIGGFMLSLLKKLEDKKLTVAETDVTTVAPVLCGDTEEQKRWVATQFRSLYYLPSLAAYVYAGKDVPHATWSEVPDIGMRIVDVDHFGNIKTSITPRDLEDLNLAHDEMIELAIGSSAHQMRLYENLAANPGQLGLAFGSSGWQRHGQPLLEIQVRGASAARHLTCCGNLLGKPITLQHFVDFAC